MKIVLNIYKNESKLKCMKKEKVSEKHLKYFRKIKKLNKSQMRKYNTIKEYIQKVIQTLEVTLAQ